MTTNRLNLGVILAGERITWPRGYSNTISYGEAPPGTESQPLNLSYTIFNRKISSFVPIDPPPFTDLVYDTASLSAAVNSLFLNVIQSLNQKVS